MAKKHIKKTPKRKQPRPKISLNDLVDIVRRGTGTLADVHFDLSPDKLASQGWQPWSLPYSPDPFYDTELTFPWDKGDPDSFAVLPGDTVIVDSIEQEQHGDELHHLSDQQTLSVRYDVIRDGEKLDLDLSEVDYCKKGTFLYVVDFNSAVTRLKGTKSELAKKLTSRVGDTTTRLSSYRKIDDEIFEKADQATQEHPDYHLARALNAAASVNIFWGMIAGALSGTSNETPRKTRLSDTIARALDAATATGYWLARHEFDPHAGDARSGKARTLSSQAGGKKRAAEFREFTDARWRNAFLAAALSMRAKYPSYGHGRLVEETKKVLAGAVSLPSVETMIEQIKSWERSGQLRRSTKNRTGG